MLSSLQSSVCTFAILMEHPKLDPPRTPSKKNSKDTPLKIHMEHNHGGLIQIIFLSKWVICRFQPLNLPGYIYKNCQSLAQFSGMYGTGIFSQGKNPTKLPQPCKTWHTHLKHPRCDRSTGLEQALKDTGLFTPIGTGNGVASLHSGTQESVESKYIYIHDFRGRRIGGPLFKRNWTFTWQYSFWNLLR